MTATQNSSFVSLARERQACLETKEQNIQQRVFAGRHRPNYMYGTVHGRMYYSEPKFVAESSKLGRSPTEGMWKDRRDGYPAPGKCRMHPDSWFFRLVTSY